MNHTKELVHRLRLRINSLEHTVSSQQKELSQVEPMGQLSTHSLEVKQENRIRSEAYRRSEMNDRDLREELENQYGLTKWAKKLINEILYSRVEARA